MLEAVLGERLCRSASKSVMSVSRSVSQSASQVVLFSLSVSLSVSLSLSVIQMLKPACTVDRVVKIISRSVNTRKKQQFMRHYDRQ